MNILIISTATLPQPAVRGGAVEGLVDKLIDYNEKYLENDISIYTIYDILAIEKSRGYSKCKFKYIKINKFINFLFRKGVLPTRIIIDIFMRKVIKDLKKRDDFEVILLENEYRYAEKIKSKIKDKRIVLHLHNDFINKDKIINNNSVRSIDNIITVSNFLKKRVKEVNESVNIKTIYNGICLEKFKEIGKDEKIELREKLNILEREFVIVFAGRLKKEKGIKELLLAFNRLPDEMNVKLLIIGGSFFEASRENKFIKELKEIAKVKKGKIIFTGYIKNSEINKLYSIADIGCIPSVWEEPFGLTVIEQMAVGLPIIVSDSGAIPEITNNNCCIMVPRGEDYIDGLTKAIINLYDDYNMRKSMSKSSKMLVSKFSSEEYSKNIYEYLYDIVKE